MTTTQKMLFAATCLSLPIVAVALLAQLPAVPSEVTETSAAIVVTQEEFANLRLLGKTAVESGIATEYATSVWNRSLDVTIPSLLPNDAQQVADAICGKAGQTFVWNEHYTVRVFLPIGDRPAASCQI